MLIILPHQNNSIYLKNVSGRYCVLVGYFVVESELLLKWM